MLNLLFVYLCVKFFIYTGTNRKIRFFNSKKHLKLLNDFKNVIVTCFKWKLSKDYMCTK